MYQDIDPSKQPHSQGPFLTGRGRRQRPDGPHLHPGASDDGRSGPLVEQKRGGIGLIILVIIAVGALIAFSSSDARGWLTDKADAVQKWADEAESTYNEADQSGADETNSTDTTDLGVDPDSGLQIVAQEGDYTCIEYSERAYDISCWGPDAAEANRMQADVELEREAAQR